MTSRAKPSRSSRSSRKPQLRTGSSTTGRRVRQVALAEVKDDLSRFLRLAESEEIVITRHGKPAGVLIGFESEDDWVDYRLQHHPEFLRRVAEAREALAAGRGVRLQDLPQGSSSLAAPSTSARSSPARSTATDTRPWCSARR